ncbi:MAG: LacI family DNA-binding transcriptional regulator [Terrimicrobiaceae bacterium]
MNAPTLKDVAARAGVSLSTASSALNGLALVNVRTRMRVEAVAREMGYRKDASAAVLATRQRRSKAAGVRLTLGYLVSETARHQVSEEFAERAEEMGYDTEWVRLRAGESPAKASLALWNRSVAGLYYASPSAVPVEGDWVHEFDWSRFAVVKFTRSRPELRFDLIRHSAFDYMARTVREVVARGYRRIGVLLGESTVGIDDEARLGALLGWEALRKPRGLRVEWKSLCGAEWGSRPLGADLHRWLAKFRPDAVIGFPEAVYWKLHEAGWRMPDDFGFASVALTEDTDFIAGCPANYGTIVEKAVDLLDHKIKAGLLGMADVPQETVIEPAWKAGSTLPGR